VIDLRQLTKRYGDRVVVDAVSLTVARGELLVLLGGSGSGKTTTLKMINRLIEPSAGHVRIDGADVASMAPYELRRRVGYAFQQIGLFPHLTIAQNVGITPRLLGWSIYRIDRRVDELLELVELDPATFRDRRPTELSGGQQQRVAIARALANNPSLLIADEPTGQLDAETGHAVMELLRAVVHSEQVTALVATHDTTLLDLADRVLELGDGETCTTVSA